MQNAYDPPGSSLEFPADIPEGFGPLSFDRALNLTWTAFKENLWPGVGATLLFGMLAVLSVFTIVGIFFFLPVLHAGTVMFGLMIVRRKPGMGSLFSGFSRYGSVLLSTIILGAISFFISLLFALPVYQHVLRGFPFDRIGLDPWVNLLAAFGKTFAEQNQDPFDPDRLWRTFFSYLNYPISMYIGGRFLLVYPLVIDRKYSAMNAVKTSWHITAPFQWWLLLLNALVGIIAGMGILACCVGLLFTIPFGFILEGAAVYQLFGEETEASPPTPSA